MVEENSIQEYLHELNFPRIYGSESERKACGIVKEKIERLKVDYKTYNFEYTNFYSLVYPRIVFALLFWFLFISFLNIGDNFLFTNYIVLFITIFILARLTRKPESIKFGKKKTSQNIIVNISGNKQCSITENKQVFFLAHLDSKSQNFNIMNRVKIFIFWFYSFFLSLTLIIFKNVFFPQYAPILFVSGAITLGLNFISVLLIYLNTTSDRSNGVLDDASGIACVLNLLDLFSKPANNLEHTNLWFVFTGGEECGTIGIRHFYKEINQLLNNNASILNFDGIGKKADLIKFGLTKHNSFKQRHIFLKNAKNHGIDLKERRVPIGVHTDGYYMFKKGYQGLEFGDWYSYKYLHTIHDTLDKVDPQLLHKICALTIDSIREIDNEVAEKK